MSRSIPQAGCKRLPAQGPLPSRFPFLLLHPSPEEVKGAEVTVPTKGRRDWVCCADSRPTDTASLSCLPPSFHGALQWFVLRRERCEGSWCRDVLSLPAARNDLPGEPSSHSYNLKAGGRAMVASYDVLGLVTAHPLTTALAWCFRRIYACCADGGGRQAAERQYLWVCCLHSRPSLATLCGDRYLCTLHLLGWGSRRSEETGKGEAPVLVVFCIQPEGCSYFILFSSSLPAGP